MPNSPSKHQPDGDFDLEPSTTPFTEFSSNSSFSHSKKRDFNDAFDCASEKAPKVLDKHIELSNNCNTVKDQKFSPMTSESPFTTPEISDDESDSSSAKLRAAALTFGTCLYASGKLVSSFLVNGTSVLINGSKSLYSFVTDTYEKNLENDKRRRLTSEPSVNDHRSLKSPTQNITHHVDANSILATASDKIPGAFSQTIYSSLSSEPPVLGDNSEEVIPFAAEPVPTVDTSSTTSTSTTLFKNSLVPISQSKISPPSVSKDTQISSCLVLKSSTPSDAGNFGDARTRQLFNGIKRKKLGLLDRDQASGLPKQLTPRSSELSNGFLLDSYDLRKAYHPDPNRTLIKKDIPYLNSSLYSHQTSQPAELPEVAPKELYSQLYMKLSLMREKRDKEQQLLRKTEEEKKAKQIEIVTPLPQDDLDVVTDLWNRNDVNTTIITAFRIDVKIHDLHTLQDGRWLNDTVIDFYMSMVTERSKTTPDKLPSCFVFSTHFFSTLENKGYKTVARWAKRKGVDVTKVDYVFVPINRFNTHWCLAVINNKEKRFDFYDSMSGAGSRALELLKDYMYQQAADMHPEIEANYEDYMEGSLKCPQQQNSHDCGVFVCKMVDVLSRDKDIMTFSQEDMPNIRRRIVYEITHNKLLT